ncbi:MAG: glutamate formimidoyltransferase [Bacteroidota bacterium]|jgi:glutamate formiminotransferase/formiminotetrahydrofolate cyclodeaminase
MRKLVECVPNFSEGQNQKIIDAITASIHDVPGARLLNVEPDKDYNRTVVTFVGEPDAVLEAAFQATKTATEHIDMTQHKGEHPRIGAADVVPFVPISGVTMSDCVQLAIMYGKRVASELNIPIYLYEFASRSPHRKNLSDIRKGEYEGLMVKLKDPAWKPDYGEPVFNAKSGATVTGARSILIAYNVNLNTADVTLAHEIALRIRESGRVMKDKFDNPVKNEKGETIKVPGTLKAVKALGVFLERFKIAQVSLNLVDFEITSIHEAYEEVKMQAQALDIDVTGSELIGLTPLTAMVKAGKFYSDNKAFTEQEYILLAVKKLGLDQFEPFDTKKKIIEYQI